MHHENGGPQTKGKQNVHEWSGYGDDEALPARMRQKLPRIAGAVVHRVFARHLHIAAERNGGDAIVGVAFLEAQQALAKADGKHFHPDAEIFGGGVVAELMNQDHESEDDPHDDNGMKKGQKLGHNN